jgi:hypothetical protein
MAKKFLQYLKQDILLNATLRMNGSTTGKAKLAAMTNAVSIEQASI